MRFLRSILNRLLSLESLHVDWSELQNKKLGVIMAKIDDLQASVATLGQTTTLLVTAVDAAVTDIQSLGPNDATLDAVRQSVDAINATLASQAGRLNDAVNATPTPAPTPAPTP